MKNALGAFADEFRLDGAADGPLCGLGFAVKDLFDIEGRRAGCGNPDWRRSHGPAKATAPAVQALLGAGAVCLGTTHMDELAYSLNGENAHFGTPENAGAPGRIPGGSSSGSAAAVAGGLVDFALGTDTGGSVRIPASYCGTFGLRPTHGRLPLEGLMPLAPSFDTIGWFAREAGIMERVGRVLLAWMEPTRPTRLVVPEDAWALAVEPVRAALEPWIERVAGLSGAAEVITLGPDGLEPWAEAFRILQAAEVWRSHGDWIGQAKPAFGPGIAARFRWAATITADRVARLEPVRAAARSRLAAVLDPATVMVMPTAPDIAPPRGQPAEDSEALRSRIQQLTATASLTGVPQLSLPVARVDGCPVGLSLLAHAGHDETLLHLAAELFPAVQP